MNSILLRNDVSRIACGWSHVLFISEECVYTYGQGSFGQLGLGSRKLVEIPEKLDLESCVNISCGFRTSFVITKNGTFCFGENRKHQLGLPINRNISEPILNEKLNFPIKIEAGNKHGVGLSNGQVFVWGQNNYGQLGLPVAEIYEPIRVEINREIINISCG